MKDSRSSFCCWNAASVALLIGIFLLSSGSLARAAMLAQQETEAETGQLTVDAIANIDLRTDLRIFTVMAAVTAAGFGSDAGPGQQGEVAAELRRDLANLDPSLVTRLRALFNARSFLTERDRHTAYTSLALLLTGPPDFKIRSDAPEIPTDVRRILGFEELLPEFYEKAHIASLWETYRPKYEKNLEAYRPIILDVIHKTIEYFHIPPRVALDRSIVVMLDLLGFRNIVHARNLERTYFIVLGPTEEPEANFVQIQHEYLHFLIDPLIEKSGGQLLKETSLMRMAEAQPNVGRDFRGRFLLIVGESLIEAVLHRLHPVAEQDVRADTVALFRRGLILFPFFTRELVKFEASGRQPFPAYLAATLVSIPGGEIAEDATQVDNWERQIQAENRAEASAQQQERDRTEKLNEMNRLLSDAGRLMGQKDWPQAVAQLNQLLQIDPENGNALFYLGQIAAQQQKHEEANGYYSRAEASKTSEPWVKAWSAVRIGRYLAHARKFEEARQKFEEVLALGDDLNGARRAAEESLAQLPAGNERP